MALTHSSAGRLGPGLARSQGSTESCCWELLISRFRLWHQPGPRRAKEAEGPGDPEASMAP